MNIRIYPLLVAALLWPTLAFGQNLFIDSPSQAETVIGPTVIIKMSVTDFQLGTDGRIRISVDGIFVEETDRLKAIIFVPPGTHQVEARLVNRRSQPIETALPEAVKFTVADSSP